MSEVSKNMGIKEAFSLLVDFVDKYGIGYVAKVFDMIDTDDTADFRNEAIQLVINDVLFEYSMTKECLLSTEDCPNKKYARIVIVNLFRDSIGSLSLSEIALILRLNSNSHVSMIYKDSLMLSPKIKTDNFAINLISMMSEKIKKLKDTKDKQNKAKAKQKNQQNTPTVIPQFQMNN